VPFYSGILLSSFALAEALTGCLWGSLSDRVGRKPILLLGCTGTMLSMVLFGFATNFWFALAVRTLGGILNGNVGIIQTMVGELVKRPEHEPRAYAVMPFVWSIGTIFGPAIAALTSNSPLFPSFPYLLPHLICAGLLLLSIVIGYFFLEETRQVAWDEDAQEDRPETESSVAVGGTTTEAGADLRSESYGTFNQVSIREEQLWKVRSDGKTRPSSVNSLADRVFNRRVIMLVISLGLYCYHSMGFNDLLPIFAQKDRLQSGPLPSGPFSINGGLGLSTHDVGVILTVNGAVAMVVQGVVFPFLAGKFGVWRLFQVTILLFPIPYFIFPLLAIVPPRALMPNMYAVMTLWNLFNIVLYPLLLILIKEACHPKHLGTINGLAASVGAIARCLAPPICGIFYSMGYSIEFSGLAWWATGAIAILGALQLPWLEREKNMASTVHAQFASGEDEEKDVIRILVEEVTV